MSHKHWLLLFALVMLMTTNSHAESAPNEDMLEFLAEWNATDAEWLEQNISQPINTISSDMEEYHD